MSERLEKVCKTCGESLPATTEYFYARPDTKDKLYADCKQCRQLNIVKKRGDDPEWHERRKEQQRKHDKELRQDEDYRSRVTRQSREHRRKRYQTDEEWRAKVAATSRQSQKQKYKEDEDFRKKVKQNASKQKSRRKGLPATFTEAEWLNCLVYWKNTCCYCEQQFQSDLLQKDHFIPARDGGGYTSSNIVPACKSCNASKGARSANEWLTWKFGEKRTAEICPRIEGYFTSINS